jgi:hypothetical protein
MGRQTQTNHPSSAISSTNGLLVLETQIEALIRAERVTLKQEETFMRFLLLLAGGLVAVAILVTLGAEIPIAASWMS